MSLVEYAEKELESFRGDEYNNMIADAALELVRVFANQGHSGFSAGLTTQIVEKLMRFEPLTPLTGEDSEWNEVGENLYQNKRSPRVFKENGRAYDIEGIVWRDPDGCCVTNYESRVDVTFPYTPTTEVRDRD
jgi:hypothetical protein